MRNFIFHFTRNKNQKRKKNNKKLKQNLATLTAKKNVAYIHAMKFIYFLIGILFSKSILSQNLVPVHLSFWNKTVNPTFSINEKSLAYLTYENKFYLKQWNNKIVGAEVKTEKGRFNWFYSQRGNTNFSSNKTSLGYTQKMSPKLNLGVCFELTFFTQAEVNNNPKLITPTFGLNYKQSNNNSFYSSLYNSGIIFHNNGLPNCLLLFWNHIINPESSFSLGYIQDQKEPIAVFIYNYFYNKDFKFSLGVNSSEIPIVFSLVYSLKSLEFLIQNTYHQKLGISTQIGLAYKW